MGSGQQRAQSFVILATFLYRASHLTVGVLTVAQREGIHPVGDAGLALSLGVSALSYGTALRRGWFDRWHVWADILVNGCALPFALSAWDGVREPTALGWAMLLGSSASAVAAVALERLHVLAAVGLLVVTHAVCYHAVGERPAALIGHVNSLLSSAAIAWARRRATGASACRYGSGFRGRPACGG
ncbi:hypothetical protein [Streptomyces sp. NPDC003480]